MNEHISALKPERLWHYFKEILEIPRPSKKEEKIAAYIVEFGEKNKLETLRDEVGNILIRKPAKKGKENIKAVTLQSHLDMVCEKNTDTEFDFLNDKIETYIEDGWVTAKGTTLGADDGIGVAAQLAILEASDIEHGPIECLFTIDEETGLTGAFGLKPGFLKGKILLNLDSEDDGELFIGCAGGIDTIATLSIEFENIPEKHTAYKIKVYGLAGGHSGDDINKGKGNANKLLNRILWTAEDKAGIRIGEFDGGNLRNAIAREAFAIVTVPEEQSSRLERLTDFYDKAFQKELKITDTGVKVSLTKTNLPAKVLVMESQNKLMQSIYACPHGVLAMSQDIPNFVETSTNLASVKMNANNIIFTTSQRSSVETKKTDACQMVSALFMLAGAKIKSSDGYPGWAPNPHSEIVDITAKLYKQLFNEEPKVLAVHAGLECGLIGDKYPGMDMISYGPTIKGAHSPDEKIKIDTVEKFWELTLEVLKAIPSS